MCQPFHQKVTAMAAPAAQDASVRCRAAQLTVKSTHAQAPARRDSRTRHPAPPLAELCGAFGEAVLPYTMQGRVLRVGCGKRGTLLADMFL